MIMPGTAATALTTASTPETARSIACWSRMSCRISTPSSFSRISDGILLGSRARPLTLWPRARAERAHGSPVRPVIPAIKMSIVGEWMSKMMVGMTGKADSMQMRTTLSGRQSHHIHIYICSCSACLFVGLSVKSAKKQPLLSLGLRDDVEPRAWIIVEGILESRARDYKSMENIK